MIKTLVKFYKNNFQKKLMKFILNALFFLSPNSLWKNIDNSIYINSLNNTNIIKIYYYIINNNYIYFIFNIARNIIKLY